MSQTATNISRKSGERQPQAENCGTPLCEMANRPGFNSTQAIDDFRRARGDDPFFVVLKWKCRYCGKWHFSEEI